MNLRGTGCRPCGAWLVWWLLAAPAGAWAQGCLLTPVPLAERVRAATVIVEAQVSGQQAEALPGGHLVTYSTLQVFAVLKGRPASPLRLLTPGGTVGLRHEVVSGLLTPAVGQQGVFLLEPDPDHAGALRLAAGPQGLLAYDLPTGTTHDPFAHYPAVGAALYPTLTALTGQPARPVQANPALAAALAPRVFRNGPSQRPDATPVISSFSPASVTAGTNTVTYSSGNGVLTINGSGFNATRGTGYVAFRNADNGGANTTQPFAGDYLAWSDTQIQVRVPSNSASGNTAGTGPVTVVNSDGSSATTGSSLTVTYALTNLDDNSQNYRIALIGNGTGRDPSNPNGYVLHYATAVPTAARTSFETALTTWRCQAGANRTIGSDASQTTATQDQVSLVNFGSLPNGVLGVTYSYYNACRRNGVYYWLLAETDYVFSNTASFYYGTGTPGSGQSDFQSVALHEQGHGMQLSHIISGTGVMNFALTTGTTRRTLDSNTDLPAEDDETTYSTSSVDVRCGGTAYATVTTNCTLPVQLVDFTARYAPGPGTLLAWTTASELHSAYFAVETQEPGAATWQELTRQPAAGQSASARHYQARDPRPLAGRRYYRLRQVDDDGTVAFSPAVAVQGEAGTLAAYPSPATGLVHLSGPLPDGASARVQLLDALGRPVRQLTATQPDCDLSLAGLPPGVYVLVWEGAPGPQRLRLVVE